MKGPGASPIGDGRVNTFHQTLLQILRQHLELGPKAVIEQLAALERGDWTRASQGARIEFHLSDKERREVGERHSGGQVPVFKLRGGIGWGSWYEKWYSSGGARFQPDSFGFTLWQGEVGSGKQQILRAEWDHVLDGTAGAAQPHWHLDVAVPDLLSVGPPVEEERAAPDAGGEEGLAPGEIDVFGAETIDLGPQAPPGRSIAKYHLGMHGRWDGPVPGWRRGWSDVLGDVPRWLELCLEYLISESRRPEPTRNMALHPAAASRGP